MTSIDLVWDHSRTASLTDRAVGAASKDILQAFSKERSADQSMSHALNYRIAGYYSATDSNIVFLYNSLEGGEVKMKLIDRLVTGVCNPIELAGKVRGHELRRDKKVST